MDSALAISMMTLLYTHTIDLDHMRGIEMAVCVTYESHNQMLAHSSSWLVAGLQHPQCICNWDAAVLPKTIDIVYGQCPGACLAPGHCLDLWWPYVYPWNYQYMRGIDMIIGVIHQCHMQAYISKWLDAGLQYLQCISNGNASVYDDRMLAMWVELKCYKGIEMLQWYN